MLSENPDLLRENEIDLITHFDTTRLLKSQLEANIKDLALELLNGSSHLKHQLDLLVKRTNIEKELVNHLKSVQCSIHFKKLVFKVTDDTAKKLATDKNFMADYSNYDIESAEKIPLREKIIKSVVSTFWEVAKENFQLYLARPSIIFAANSDAIASYNGINIFFNPNEELHKGGDTGKFNILTPPIHESVHALQDNLEFSRHSDKFTWDSLIYEQSSLKDGYIFKQLSPKAYQTQAVEEIAFLTTEHFHRCFKKYRKAEKSGQPGAPAP